jgi:hypothetical protein
MYKISLRIQFPVEGNILKTLQLRNSGLPTARPDAQMPESGRSTYRAKVLWRFEHFSRSMLRSESKSPEGVWTAQHTQATNSQSLQEGLDADEMITNCESTLCNHLNARVVIPDKLQWLLKILSCRSGRQRPGPNAAYEIRVWVELGFLMPI